MRLAILDNDREFCALFAETLSNAGHSSIQFNNSADLRRGLQRDSFDALVLDWELPETPGAVLLASVRNAVALVPPVVMLSSQAGASDIVDALNTGADAHVLKPVAPEVLTAQVEALLRRRHSGAPVLQVEEFGRHRFDSRAMTVSVDNVRVEVTAKEFGLALLLFRNINRSLSRAHIMETVWGRNPAAASRTLDAHVSQIRGSLSLRPEHGLRLASIYSFGYRLEGLEAGN